MAALALVTPSTARAGTRELFAIARSLNANEVHYAAHVTAGGELDAKRPLLAYWRLYAEHGQREELSWFEWQFAYGFRVLQQTARQLELRLVAFPERSVVVRREATGQIRAEVRIQAQPALLRRIFVQLGDGPGWSVRHVDLIGVALSTGRTVRERIAAH